MRIALIITELNPGGAERCLTEIAIGLKKLGEEVQVFSIGSQPVPERSTLVDRLQRHSIAIEFANVDNRFRFLTARHKLRRFLEGFQPDIVQTLLYHANVLGGSVARSTGFRCLVSGIRVAEARPLRLRIERAALRHSRHVVCVSEAVRDFAQSHLSLPPGKVSVIPNGVDTDRFSAALPVSWSSIGWPNDVCVSLFVGRMHRQKGIELIQQEIDRLAPSGTCNRVLLIGDGPLQDSIDAWASQVGADRVKRVGWQADIAPWIKASKVLLLPSHYEGMPNVVLEAMAAGLPVVISDVQGSSELVSHACESQRFPAGDSQAMASLAESFLSNPDHSQKMGLQNQVRVRNDFAIKSMVNRYRTLYDDLLR